MKVLYTPQFNPIDKLSYEFENEKVIVTLNEQVEVFDFNVIPDEVTTTLKINPFIDVRRVNGELNLVLLNFHSNNASSAVLYPDWVTIKGVN